MANVLAGDLQAEEQRAQATRDKLLDETTTTAAAATLLFDRLFDSALLAGLTALLVTLPPAIWLTGRALDRWSLRNPQPV